MEFSPFFKALYGVTSKNKEISIEKLKQTINKGQVFKFLLRANPTKKIKDIENNKVTNQGKVRVPIIDEDEILKWSARQFKEFSESASSSAKTLVNRLKDEEVKEKFRHVGKAAEELGKSIADCFKKGEE